MPYLIPQPILTENATYVFFDKAFSDIECDKIIELHKTLPEVEAIVGSGEKDGVVDLKKRRAAVHWIQWQQDQNWLFQKLSEHVSTANNKWFNLHLSSMSEALQLTHYKGSKKSGGFYDFHSDHAFSTMFCHRKMSGILLLNNEFEGGDFEMFSTGKVSQLTKGSLILFPSFQVHRVLPVTKGNRWSLVFWVSGPLWC